MTYIGSGAMIARETFLHSKGFSDLLVTLAKTIFMWLDLWGIDPIYPMAVMCNPLYTFGVAGSRMLCLIFEKCARLWPS